MAGSSPPPFIPAGYFFSDGQIHLPKESTSPTSSSASPPKTEHRHYSSLFYILHEDWPQGLPSSTPFYIPRINPPLPDGVLAAIQEAIRAQRVQVTVSEKTQEAGAGGLGDEEEVEGLVPSLVDFHLDFEKVMTLTAALTGAELSSPIPPEGNEGRPAPPPVLLRSAGADRASTARAAAGRVGPKSVEKYSAGVDVGWTPAKELKVAGGTLPAAEVVLEGVARALRRPILFCPLHEEGGEEGAVLVAATEHVAGFKKFVREMRRARRKLRRRRKGKLRWEELMHAVARAVGDGGEVRR